MEIYKVKESDLIGDIKAFPIEVVQKMVERQHEQTGKCDVTVFQIHPARGIYFGGFNWDSTKEGYDFWDYVITEKSFKRFFARYPKQIQEQGEDCWVKPEGVRMLVWDDYEEYSVERIVIAKLPENTYFTYVCVCNTENNEEKFKNGEKYATEMYKNAKPIPQIKKITMQEIAEKFGLKVDEFKIV